MKTASALQGTKVSEPINWQITVRICLVGSQICGRKDIDRGGESYDTLA